MSSYFDQMCYIPVDYARQAREAAEAKAAAARIAQQQAVAAEARRAQELEAAARKLAFEEGARAYAEMLRMQEEARRTAELARTAADAARFAMQFASDAVSIIQRDRFIETARQEWEKAQKALTNFYPITGNSISPVVPTATQAPLGNTYQVSLAINQQVVDNFFAILPAREMPSISRLQQISTQPVVPTAPELTLTEDQSIKIKAVLEEENKLTDDQKKFMLEIIKGLNDPRDKITIKELCGLEIMDEDYRERDNYLTTHTSMLEKKVWASDPDLPNISDPVHQMAIEKIILGQIGRLKVFSSYDAYVPKMIKVLKAAQVYIDSDDFQTNEYSHLHAMTGQHLVDAYAQELKAKLNKTKLDHDDMKIVYANARKDAVASANKETKRLLQNAIDRKGHNLKTRTGLLGLMELGYVLHTLQDSTSPSHIKFQIWNSRWGRHKFEHLGVLSAHALPEYKYPEEGTNQQISLERATLWAWQIYIGSEPMPENFFDPITGEILIPATVKLPSN